MFAGSIGRVDLPGGSMADMERSLREVILPMEKPPGVSRTVAYSLLLIWYLPVVTACAAAS